MMRALGFLCAWAMHWGAFYTVTMFVVLGMLGPEQVYDNPDGRRMALYMAIMIVSPVPALWQMIMFNVMSGGEKRDTAN